MPVFKDYDVKEGYNVAQDINYVILKSGDQKIRYKIFSKEKESYIGIEVYTIDNKNKDLKTIKNYERTIKMSDSGVYEGEFTFDALVPYENKGWSEGQDLTTFDKKELETAVVAFYQKMWNIYHDKSKKEEQFPLIVEREREIALSKYYFKKDLEEILEENLLPYTNSSYEMLSLEDYKMVFYGNGKAVALEQANLTLPLRGYSALGAKYKTEKGSTLGDMTQLILFLPQGKSLKDGLQIIR
jgi:hypothetical protein